MELKELDFDLRELNCEVDCSYYVPTKEITVRGSDKAYMKVSKDVVKDIQEYAKGFLFGSLYKRGLTLNEVVFLPADTIEHINTKGKPVYIFELEDHYELECWFISKQEYLSLVDDDIFSDQGDNTHRGFNGGEAYKKKCLDFILSVRNIITSTYAREESYSATARRLNEQNIKTMKGFEWYPATVSRAMKFYLKLDNK